MMKGFFNKADVTSRRTRLSTVPLCGSCGLYKTCKSPKMAPSGEGRRKILLLGEAPGQEEDKTGIQFVGSSGRYLERVLARVGIDMRRDCWITNSLICRPPDNVIKNPSKMIEACRPNLVRTIQEFQPEVIVPMGSKPVQSLLGWLWKEDVGAVNRWVGWRIPCQKLNCWITPTWHPSHLLRSEGEVKQGKGQGREAGPVMEKLFEEHLRGAGSLRARPWKELPDYDAQVERVVDTDLVSGKLLSMMESKEPIAFDYESDRLKPDHPEATILSCSMSNGSATISFPWHGKAILAVRDFLKSNHPKVGQNLKFENRWTKRVFGFYVNNVVWDSMIVAHLLDNRKNVTSLKFQAFVLLGAESYDDVLKPLMRSEGGNSRNRLDEIGLSKLLLYGGKDALFTWQICKIQMEKLGYVPMQS